MKDLEPRGGASEGSDPDGVRVIAVGSKARRTARMYQTAALLLASACVGYVVMPRPSAQPSAPAVPARPHGSFAPGADASSAASLAKTAPAQAGTAAPAVAVAPLNKHPVTPRRVASHRPEQEPPDFAADEVASQLKEAIKEGREVTAGEYIKALNDAGIHEGIGAFQPPGTKPPLEGLVVPPDYELPEGYVRHFQSTDDGQPIDPILMYSPDYEFFDENGNPIPIPEDRVVPPEYAPPGFPIQPVQIPGKREPGDLSR